MSSPRGREPQLLFLSVNRPKWLLPPVLVTLGLYTNETKGFVKDPNRSGSGDVATSSKHAANEPQRASQRGGERIIMSFLLPTSLPYSLLLLQVGIRRVALCPGSV